MTAQSCAVRCVEGGRARDLILKVGLDADEGAALGNALKQIRQRGLDELSSERRGTPVQGAGADRSTAVCPLLPYLAGSFGARPRRCRKAPGGAWRAFTSW
ncbi:hypothetical protein GCM10022267_90010 [Lentzea roselyniae]|uniref:Uncharacterized protein n=1 Tax=Lentzea roselyniae TaxID=531940 RepID=A0ABP7CEX2_9PSEU